MLRCVRSLILAGLLATTVTSSLPAAPPAGPPAVIDSALWDAMGVAQPTRPFAAPAFTLADLGGRQVSLRDLQGRVVLLYFWATW